MRDMKAFAALVNARLETIVEALPEGSCDLNDGMPWLLADAMRYSLLADGKRLRPSMLLMAVEMLGGDADAVLDIACAVEMIHTYSLIHDDLPGMDNDTMRRGRPTSHVVFGEGQAILAGDGLLNCAFERMLACALRRPGEEAASLRAIAEIAQGAGVTGMIAGQVMDLYCERERKADVEDLEYIQLNKTARMFMHPLRAAGHLAHAAQDEIEALGRYGRAFGLLFQATDDLLDVVGSADEVGKTLGKDAASGKLTCVTLSGVEATRERVLQLRDEAHKTLARFGEKADGFRALVDDMVDRTA